MRQRIIILHSNLFMCVRLLHDLIFNELLFEYIIFILTPQVCFVLESISYTPHSPKPYTNYHQTECVYKNRFLQAFNKTMCTLYYKVHQAPPSIPTALFQCKDISDVFVLFFFFLYFSDREYLNTLEGYTIL